MPRTQVSPRANREAAVRLSRDNFPAYEIALVYISRESFSGTLFSGTGVTIARHGHKMYPRVSKSGRTSLPRTSKNRDYVIAVSRQRPGQKRGECYRTFFFCVRAAHSRTVRFRSRDVPLAREKRTYGVMACVFALFLLSSSRVLRLRIDELRKSRRGNRTTGPSLSPGTS